MISAKFQKCTQKKKTQRNEEKIKYLEKFKKVKIKAEEK